MVAICLSETSVDFYRTTRRNIPVDRTEDWHWEGDYRSALKIEVARSTKISVNIYQTTMCQIYKEIIFTGPATQWGNVQVAP
jgi:hypothetical protein